MLVSFIVAVMILVSVIVSVIRIPTVVPTSVVRSAAAQAIMARVCRERGVAVLLRKTVVGVEGRAGAAGRGALVLEDGGRVECDECVWCTSAGGESLLVSSPSLSIAARIFAFIINGCFVPADLFAHKRVDLFRARRA